MSTTIYRGKRLQDMSVYQLNQFYKKLRSELVPAAKTEYYKLVVKVSQEIYVYLMTGQYPGHYDIDLKKIDEKSAEFRADAKSILEHSREFVNNMITKTSSAIFSYDAESDADLDVSLVVIPIKDKTLCLPYANHDDLYNLLIKRDEITEYGYWNNTDPPEDMNECEWDQRKADWDEALPSIGIPKNNGMVLHIVDAVSDILEYHYIDIRDKFMSHMIDDEEFLTKVANGVILHREYMKLMESDDVEEGRDKISVAMRCLRISTEYIKDHPEEVEETKSIYRPMLNSKEFFSIGLFGKN